MKKYSLDRHLTAFMYAIATAVLFSYSASPLAQEVEQSVRPLDGRARLLSPECSKAIYPAIAMRNEIEGTVTLSFLIGVDGAVLEPAVLSSSGNPYLDKAARIAVSRCKFAPAIVGGKPVEERSTMAYVFSLRPLFESRY